MLTIDGSLGEGGGQMLRTALALSILTGRAFTMQRIRANRSTPGVGQQHLTCIRAAAEISQAQMQGAATGSHTVAFFPGSLRGGEYRFRVGTAGSTSLVLQTILPPLMCAAEPSLVTIEGGTHNVHAPPFDFLKKVFFPLLHRAGVDIRGSLLRHGFYPRGGGCVRFEVRPATRWTFLELTRRGPMIRRLARIVTAGLPDHVAQREAQVLRERFAGREDDIVLDRLPEAFGPGNVVMIEMISSGVTELVTAFGQRGVPAEKVAHRAADEAEMYLEGGAPVGEHLADQLLLPLALGAGGRFVTHVRSSHLLTNAQVIAEFLGTCVHVQPAGKNQFEVSVAGRASEVVPGRVHERGNGE